MGDKKNIRLVINVCPLLQPNLHEFLCNQDRKEHSVIIKRIVEDKLISDRFDASQVDKEPFKIEVYIDHKYYPATYELLAQSPKMKRAKKFTGLAEEWNVRFEYDSIKIPDFEDKKIEKKSECNESVLDEFDLEKIDGALNRICFDE